MNDFFSGPEGQLRLFKWRFKHISRISKIHSERREEICHLKQFLKTRIQLLAFTHQMHQVMRLGYGYRPESEPAFQGLFRSLLAVVGSGIEQRVCAINHALRRLQIPLGFGHPLQGNDPHFIHGVWQECGLHCGLKRAMYLRYGPAFPILGGSAHKHPSPLEHQPLFPGRDAT